MLLQWQFANWKQNTSFNATGMCMVLVSLSIFPKSCRLSERKGLKLGGGGRDRLIAFV